MVKHSTLAGFYKISVLLSINNVLHSTWYTEENNETQPPYLFLFVLSTVRLTGTIAAISTIATSRLDASLLRMDGGCK
ncbi:hypothetical protein [Nostoc sp.]|uniref:hypothetical protein n=1 Tax=Nostoc sp. TaxID=1180 RepID=UPI002FF50CD0